MLSKDRWFVLAGGFPPTLNTNAPQTELKPNETPSCTGISPTAEGYIAGSAIPSGTTRVAKTYSVGGGTYNWYYERLWKINTTTLEYGAPDYTATYYRQGPGEIALPDDSNSNLVFLPIGETGLIVFRASGAYIIPNANDREGKFQWTELIQEAKIADATHAVELDGIVYFCNTNGVFKVAVTGQMDEISFPIRGSVTPAAIVADYKNKLLIIGTTHVYDVNMKRWFAYSGSDFVFQTRRMRSANSEPFAVDMVGFEFVWVSGTAVDTLVQIQYQTQVEDRNINDTNELNFLYDRGREVFAHQAIKPDMGRDFMVKVTTLPSELKLKRILIRADSYSAESKET